MKTINATELEYAGSFTVDSGQAIIGDPCYLDKYDTNVNDPWDLEGKVGQYSYQGISATTLAHSFGQIQEGLAVAFTTGYGDGAYPVYVQFNDEGRISKVVIDFDGDLDEEQE